MKNFLILSLTIMMVFLLLHDCSSANKYLNLQEKYDMNISALQDTVVHYKDENGLQAAKIGVLHSSNAAMIADIGIEKETVKLLKQEVLHYKNKVVTSTVFQTVTQFDTTFTTDTMYYKEIDTVLHVKESFPTYGVKFNDSWINIEGTVDKETTTLTIGMNNEYAVSVVKKKRKYEAIVKNSNPYCYTKDIAAYKLDMPKPKKFGIGVSVGYGLDLLTLRPSPYVGVGISYNLIRF